MIRLLDLISIAGVTLADFKIHFATQARKSGAMPGPCPMEAFIDGKWKEWQEGQNLKNFNCAHILSLIYARKDHWLFAGVYAVDGVRMVTRLPKPRYRYETTELPGLEHLVGRAIVRFEKTFRQSYPRGQPYGDELAVVAILEERHSVGEFPGYNRILVSH